VPSCGEIDRVTGNSGPTTRGSGPVDPRARRPQACLAALELELAQLDAADLFRSQSSAQIGDKKKKIQSGADTRSGRAVLRTCVLIASASSSRARSRRRSRRRLHDVARSSSVTRPRAFAPRPDASSRRTDPRTGRSGTPAAMITFRPRPTYRSSRPRPARLRSLSCGTTPRPNASSRPRRSAR